VNTWINLNALWKIIVIGLLAGAGLPALFAVGLRALNPRTSAGGAVVAGSAGGAVAQTGAQAQPAAAVGRAGLLGTVFAVLCFAVILAAIGWGIYSIVHNS
jgi:fucose permease